MLYFYYGEDSFSSFEEVQKIKADYLKKSGSDFGLVILEGGRITFEQFVNHTLSDSFFSDRKLIIIKNFLRDNSDKELKRKVADYIKKVPQSVDLIFLEDGMPDRRESIFKVLTSNRIVYKEFPLSDNFKLTNWIKNRAKTLDIEISSSAAAKLSLYLGSNLWRQSSEIEKLALFVKSQDKKIISDSDIDKLVEPEGIAKIFDLTDALTSRNEKKSVEILIEFLKKGEDESMVFNMIIYHFRNMLMVLDLAKNKPKETIAKEAKLHPFVVQKILANRMLKLEDLFAAYKKLSDLDWAIKKGSVETKTALSLFIVDFCHV